MVFFLFCFAVGLVRAQFDLLKFHGPVVTHLKQPNPPTDHHEQCYSLILNGRSFNILMRQVNKVMHVEETLSEHTGMSGLERDT